MSLFAVIFAMISVLWQHIASVAVSMTAQNMAYGNVQGKVGVVAMVLGWTGLGLFLSHFVFIAISWLSIRLLNQLVDDDEGL